MKSPLLFLALLGLLVHLVATSPLPWVNSYEDDSYEDDSYDDDYYDDYYDDYEKEPLAEPEAEPEPEVVPEYEEVAPEGLGEEAPGGEIVPEGLGEEALGEETVPEGLGEEALGEETVPEGLGEEAPGEETVPEGLGEEAPGNETVPEVALVPVAAPAPHTTPKSCKQPPDAGTCRGYFPMFYFDPATGTCRPFVYGGCRGTANVYKTSSDCYSHCNPAGLTRSSSGEVGEFLTLHHGSGPDANILKFPGHDAAIRVDDQMLTQFSITKVYQIEFFFRTDTPHGLITFLRQSWVPQELEGSRIQLYVYVKRGRLGVTHIFGQEIETFLMKKGGMQGGSWHSGLVKVDATTGQLVMEVDASQETFTIASLIAHPSYHVELDDPGLVHVWVGGVFKEDQVKEEVTGGIVHFHGCLKKFGLMSGESSSTMVRIKPLSSAENQRVSENCDSNCKDRYRNMCSSSSHCVEHFDHSTCNCFNSGKDGRRCTDPEIPVLTLNTDGYVVHRVYEWMDRVHTYNNLFSFDFKIKFANSILFYASAEHPERQYVAASITHAGTIYVEANFGGGAVSTEFGRKLTFMTWHSFTLIHQHDRIQVYLDSRLEETLVVPGEVRYLNLDPDVYIGNAPNLTRYCGLPVDRGSEDSERCHQDLTRYYYHVLSASCLPFNYSGCGGNDNSFLDHDTCMNTCHTRGLRSLNAFQGCMKNFFINDISVLYELQERNKTTRYYGATKDVPLSTSCNSRKMMLLTLSTEAANFRLTNPNPDNFRIVASFKPSQPRGVLASGFVDVMETWSEWELRHDQNYVYFYVHDNLVNVKSNTKIEIGHWQYVDVRYSEGSVQMRVNQKTVTQRPGLMKFSTSMSIGLNLLQDYPGLVGCLRELEVGGVTVDLRALVGTTLAHRDVTYDNCQLLRPCERLGACEHGATCRETDDGVECDCSGTGYTGSKCYFSLYKKSCEQYHQIGYNISGIYKIDVDGNGPLPPSFVKCQFNSYTGEITTVVEHNMRPKFRVRRPDLDNLRISVQYRDFSPEMLKALIAQSKTCTQVLKYECRRSPLSLSTYTWFSSPSEPFITNFGSETAGLCRCREVDGCDEPVVPCNCDVVDGLPRSDLAIMKDPHQLPITSMVFLQDRRYEKEDSEGFLTMGPLMCNKEASEEHTVSFRQAGTFLEVPAWREGSLFLIFKTTTKSAVIAYQPAYHPSHATFRIALVGDKDVEFMYEFHGTIHRHRLTTSRRLNTGSWQQILIDLHDHQLRLVVNSEQHLVDINKDAYLGVLDGSMFLGGVPSQFMTEELEEEGLESLVGCIRGLTMKDEVVDLDRYIRAAPHGVAAGCNPSCEPNPCRNGATCVEYWGTYECVCANPLAHSGKNCENNINDNALTFAREDSKFRYFVNNTESMGEYNLLNNSFLINFRTHADSGLILLAVDYLHNFLQFHLAAPDRLVLLFNSGKDFKMLSVVTSDGVVFNSGQSVQVAVERTTFSTKLVVFTKGSFFNATVEADLSMIQEENYEQFPFGESRPVPEKVYYPHSVTMPHPFHQVFLGSATDRLQDMSSVIPGLVGCIRGFKIGSKLVPLDDLVAKARVVVDGVQVNCSLACDMEPCLNGGTCTEDFQYFNNFRCDCSDTSYTGAVCNYETAYSFFGRQWISRTATVSPVMEEVVFQVAFSVSRRHPRPQLVAFLRSTNPEKPSDYMLVAVEPDGAILVEAQLGDLDPENILGVRLTSATHGFNAFNGDRHYVVMAWEKDMLSITVDREKRSVYPLRWINQDHNGINTTPTGMYLGGIEEDIDHRMDKYDDFHGCISNVRVSNPVGTAVPLLEYSQNDKHLRSSGVPGLDTCAGFSAMATPGIVLAYRNQLNVSAVMGSEWVYNPAHALNVHAIPAAATHPERDTPMDNVVPIVCGVIFLVVAAIVGAFLCVTRDQKKKKKAKEAQRQPLYNETARNTKTNILKVTETAELVPLKSAPDGILQGANDDAVTKPVVVETAALQKEAPKDPDANVEVRHSSKITSDEDSEYCTCDETGDSSGNGGDRPLSWDKATDNLPLISSAQKKTKGEESGSDNSSQSSIHCTIDITGTPSSSPKLERHPNPSLAESSPSSTRVQPGSLLYIDDDMDTEPEIDSTPKLLRHDLLPVPDLGDEERRDTETQMQNSDGEGQDEVTEEGQEPVIFGAGQIQKIVKDDDENEFVVVDVLEISDSKPEDSQQEYEETVTSKLEEVEKARGECDAVPSNTAEEQKEQVLEEKEGDKVETKEREVQEEYVPETTTRAEVDPDTVLKIEETKPEESEVREEKEADRVEVVEPEIIQKIASSVLTIEPEVEPDNFLITRETEAQVKEIADEPNVSVTTEGTEVNANGENFEGEADAGTKTADTDSSSSSSSDKEAENDAEHFPPPPPELVTELEITTSPEATSGELSSAPPPAPPPAPPSSSDSEEEFIELRPECENVHDAHRMSSKPN